MTLVTKRDMDDANHFVRTFEVDPELVHDLAQAIADGRRYQPSESWQRQSRLPPITGRMVMGTDDEADLGLRAAMMIKYRPHRGLLRESMAEVIEVASLEELVRRMREEVQNWYPVDKLPTIENTKVEPYTYDNRIMWDTYIVTVDGQAWGFTNGPLT